jgi:transglutaminase-like putative cysteine protease
LPARLRHVSRPDYDYGNLARVLEIGKNEIEFRKDVFDFVKNFPYRITRFTPQKGDLLLYRRGDCRHKTEALLNIFRAKGYPVRKVEVLFDWKDLPIPEEILGILKSETKGFHDAAEVKIDGKWVYVDATWDDALISKNFPVTQNWDGFSDTREITAGATRKFYPAKSPDISAEKTFTTRGNLYEKAGLKYPVNLSEIQQFGKSLNDWLGN